jgi:hypothetical protein
MTTRIEVGGEETRGRRLAVMLFGAIGGDSIFDPQVRTRAFFTSV